ncbi:B12-binding domain-containing radical SAM protein [Photobacterium gaetbulicola]|uniref:B12-binding domain-containing radical SAM protein n=1 Tax=Photobacterium gaetbulicola TaxID=1295392 RepID=UPI0013C2CCB4|nr:radical SAM protein [Photobacterium gaetbulicola]
MTNIKIKETPVSVLVLSTYEAYLQPLTAAKLSRQLKQSGCEVRVVDCFVQSLDIKLVKSFDNIAISVPLSDSITTAIKLLNVVRELNPKAKVALFGAHAILNKVELETQYSVAIPSDVAGFFTGLKTANDHNIIPDRESLLGLKHYVYPGGLINDKVVANIETTEGCRFKCTHCSVFSLAKGKVLYKKLDCVMEEIAFAVENGAEHISFTDPEFMNNATHTPAIIDAMHCSYPHLTFDVITRVDRLLRYKDAFITFFDKGCRFITTAIEFPDDKVLKALQKGYRTKDLGALAELIKTTDIVVNPTLITFTPWVDKATILAGEQYLAEIGLTEIIDPVQSKTRLMLTKDSNLLGTPHLEGIELSETEFGYDWCHPDQEVDELYRQRVSTMGGGFNRCCVRC